MSATEVMAPPVDPWQKSEIQVPSFQLGSFSSMTPKPSDPETGRTARALALVDKLTDPELADALYAVRPDLYEEAYEQGHIEAMRRKNPKRNVAAREH